MPNTSILFPASPAVNQQYTYGTTTYVYTGTNWAVYVSSASLPAFITSANIVDGTIVNADINASAAIDGSKISPVFTGTLTATGGVAAASLTSKIQPITASIGSNALTITLNPTILDFRSSTLTSGTVTTVVVPAAISLIIPAGATIGTVSAVQSRIVVLAINNAGTVELAAVNISGGSPLDETTLITTVTNASGGNSATAYYSTTARSNVAYRVVGYIESTQATAGTWATTPSTIQGMGGQALAAMSSLGYGQTWQTVTRSTGTTYYNTTGKPITFYYTAEFGTGNTSIFISINGAANLVLTANVTAVTTKNNALFIIPVGTSYILSTSGGAVTNVAIAELR